MKIFRIPPKFLDVNGVLVPVHRGKKGRRGEPWEQSVTKFGVYDFYFCCVAWVP